MPFPESALLPKHRLSEATSDGRGCLVCILDTGVDPSAPNLQVTSTGTRKLIDIVDCSGSGDVTLSTPCMASPSTEEIKGTSPSPLKIVGLSGRTLTLPADAWGNSSKKFRLGLKRAEELWPKTVIKRVKKDRKERFDALHSQIYTQVSRAKPDLKDDEYKARLDVLKDLQAGFADPLPMWDVLVWCDANEWRVVVDTSESGDLTAEKVMRNYYKYHDIHSFTKSGWGSEGEGGDGEPRVTFTVNIWEEGAEDVTVEIVTNAGSHGTHVAAITAAHCPSNTALDGVAPGAQLISLKIGDTRLGSMETGASLVRAAIYLGKVAKERGFTVHLANMSYGEPIAQCNQGRFGDLLKDVVNEGLMFISSAGNAGPALTTVGAPGGTTSHIFSVGAYVTPELMQSSYALLENGAAGPYTWSSRGPTSDGSAGVDVYAPGGAITSIPECCLAATQLMNGTSMSSPNACGLVALLVSACQQEKITWSPYRLSRAIKNTVRNIHDPFGVGFFQVADALDFLRKTKDELFMDIAYDVTVPSRDARGIYLRDVGDMKVSQIAVTVKPKFLREKSPTVNAERLKLEINGVLKSTQPWVQCPEFAHITSAGRDIPIEVDPSNLPPGLHCAQVLIHDSSRPHAGTLVSIPITVCKPEKVLPGYSHVAFTGLAFGPGKIDRKFVAVPHDAQFAELVVRSLNRPTTSRFFVHLIQLEPHSRYTKHESDFVFGLGTNGSVPEDQNVFTKYFPVLPGVTLEVCLAQFWSSIGESNVDVEIKFHGVGLKAGEIVLNSGNNGIQRVDLAVSLRKEEVSPSVSLDTIRRFIRPTSHEISTLKSRDVLPNSHQIHQLVLTYEFKLASGDAATVTPRFPKLNGVLYDSIFENMAVMIFDANKKVLDYQDIYPKSVKLTGGEGPYTIKVQVCSRSPVELLEKLQHMVLVLDQSLTSNASVPVFWSLSQALGYNPDGESKKSKVLTKGDRTPLFFGDIETLPKDAKVGDMLVGELKLLGGSVKLGKPLYPVVYVIPPPEPKEKEVKNGDDKDAEKDKKDETELMKEAVRDLMMTWTKKHDVGEKRGVFISGLEAQFPNHLPLLKLKLDNLVEAVGSDETGTEDDARAVAKTSDEILALIDQIEVAKYFAVKRDAKTEKDKQEKSDMDKKKEIMISCMYAKAKASKDLIQIQKSDNADADFEKFEKLLADYLQWSGVSEVEPKYLWLRVFQLRRKKQLGLALKIIHKFLSDGANMSGDKAVDFKKIHQMKQDLLAELGWTLWIDYEKKWGVVNFPKGFASF